MASKITVRVVKADWLRKLGTWCRVSPEMYARYGPAGSGHLAAPNRQHRGVPDASELELVHAPPPLVEATPEAGELAETADVELGLISGSGQGGRILKRDVEAVVKAREE